MKNFLFLMFPLFIAHSTIAQTPVVLPIEVTIKRVDINRMNEETELVISVRDLGRDFLKVKSFVFSLKDDQGNDMVAKGKENLDTYEKKGFFTSRSSNWEFFNYSFYKIHDAFGGKLIVYSSPSNLSKQIHLHGEIQVWVKGKTTKTTQHVLNNIQVVPDQEYEVAGGSVKFIENGTLALDDTQFKGYKVVSDIPITSVSVVGQKKFKGLPVAQDEIFVSDLSNEISLLFLTPETQVITVPVDLKFAIGL